MSKMPVWLPLESNPEVLSKYMVQLGVSPLWSVTDIYGTDDELLEMLPKPVRAVIFLFPISDAYETYRAKEDAELKDKKIEHPDSLFYVKQYVHNACGTIALIHAVLNNPDIELEDGSTLKSFYEESKALSPEERGNVLQNDSKLTQTHESIANEGQTETPNLNDVINNHFIAFVHVDGKLYELDGRKSSPIQHGTTTPDGLLKDAIAVCKQYIARDPNEVRFTLLGLVPTQ